MNSFPAKHRVIQTFVKKIYKKAISSRDQLKLFTEDLSGVFVRVCKLVYAHVKVTHGKEGKTLRGLTKPY